MLSRHPRNLALMREVGEDQRLGNIAVRGKDTVHHAKIPFEQLWMLS